jgi:hypothetical protein
MFGSVVLDVAIGMAFVFLLLALIASTVQEFLATLVQARSANLLRGLCGLFSGGTLEDGTSFVERIYNHGLIQGLYRDDRDFPSIARPTPAAGQFSEPRRNALLPRNLLQRLMRLDPVPPLKDIKDLSVLPSYIPARTFALALIDLLNEKHLSGPEAAHAIRARLLAVTNRSPENKAFQALLALANHAEDDLTHLGEAIEQWYSDVMDRVSGWYKKNTQYILLGIGAILALTLNVDSIRVAQTLWFDRDVRQSMVDAARATPAPPVVGSTSSDQLRAKLQDDITGFQATTETLLPVGWNHDPFSTPAGIHPGNWRQRTIRITSALAGWAITALAISLGAAFWFDTLNKFVVVRNTIKPQEKSRPEASKDPTS